MWQQVEAILPPMEICLQRAYENVENWQQHQETEEEKKVYELPPFRLTLTETN